MFVSRYKCIIVKELKYLLTTQLLFFANTFIRRLIELFNTVLQPLVEIAVFMGT